MGGNEDDVDVVESVSVRQAGDRIVSVEHGEKVATVKEIASIRETAVTDTAGGEPENED